MLPLFYVISHYSNLPFRAWEQRKVSDYAINTYGGGTPKTNVPEYWSGEIPWIQSSDLLISNLFNVIPKKYITELAVKSSATKFIPANSIAIVSRVGVGKLVFMPFEYTTSQDFLSLSNLQVDSNFGVYSIYMMLQKELKNIQGTSIKGITKTDLLEKNINKPSSREEQQKIGAFFKQLDNTITLHQRKLDTLKQMKKGLLQQMFPKSEEDVPKIRFADFDEEWYQRKLGEEFEKINERNDGSFGKTHWISVAKMYFVEPNKVLSNNIDTRTYVMRKGDIAFEGHSNTDFKFGRFVANDIGPGIVSELFPVYRHKTNYDNNYWKNAIQLEHIMAPIYSKSITSSGNSSNKLDSKHFLNQKIYIADFEEQEKIGSIFKQLDNTIILYQNKLNKFDILKKAYLQTMFI
ncbi:restriction endonuclease subunit S [Listeria monocytogenes]|nr:restriction endonuclease subunit S [Listeria monocytogenes]